MVLLLLSCVFAMLLPLGAKTLHQTHGVVLMLSVGTMFGGSFGAVLVPVWEIVLVLFFGRIFVLSLGAGCKTDWDGDSLAYLGQKCQLHHVSKVNLKQWHKGSKILFFVVWLTKIPMGIINQLWR